MSRVAVGGYLHPAYAASIAEEREPRVLPGSGGSVLVRAIPGTGHRDAVGCYPLFACREWDALDDDLRALAREMVSVVLVTDPFGAYDVGLLARCFPDRCIPYKEHFVTDLRCSSESFVARHHRRNVQRARRHVEVEVCARPADHADEWVALYAHLVRRHGVVGAAAFSRRSLEAQLAVPGLVALRAVVGGATVGMTLWFEQGNDVAYYHLGAYADAGYDHGAAFAVFAAAIDHFRGRVGWLALGAGAGVTNAGADGLTRFKRGWATGTRTAYLCGRVLDGARYAALSAGRDDATSYFPAYRAPVAGAPAADLATVPASS